MPQPIKPPAARRLFTALWPDEATRAALARCRDGWRWGAAAAPEPTERLHLTLHFIGSVPEARVGALLEGLRVPCPRFGLRLESVRRWPNGIALLAPKVVPRELIDLHAALGDRLRGLGFATESRRYEPHVTLARHAGGSALPGPTPVDWQVDGYVLVESRSREYLVQRRWPAADRLTP